LKILIQAFGLLVILTATMAMFGQPASAKTSVPNTTVVNGKKVTLKSFKDGLKYYDIKVGTGVSPKAGQTVSVLYTGTLLNGQVFDSTSLHGGQPIDFAIGVGQVIPGWDEGVIGNKANAGMKVGGIRRLVIPGKLAYGENPPPGSPIAPDATLIFDITLDAVK
jgi:peptidylprolyl isomerase